MFPHFLLHVPVVPLLLTEGRKEGELQRFSIKLIKRPSYLICYEKNKGQKKCALQFAAKATAISCSRTFVMNVLNLLQSQAASQSSSRKAGELVQVLKGMISLTVVVRVEV